MNWKGRQMFGGRPNGIVQMMGGGMTPYPTHVMPDGTVMPGAVHGQGYEAGGLLIGKDQFVDPSPDGQEMLTEETRVLKGLYNDIIKAMEQTSMDFGTIIDSRVTQGSVTRKAAEDLKKVYAIQKMRQTQKMQDLPFRPGMAPKPEDFFPSGPPTKKEALEYLDREQKMLKPARPNMQAGGMVGAELFEEGDSDINNALNTMASVSNPEVPDMPASNGMSILGGEMGGGEMTMDQGPGYENAVMQLKEQFKNEIRNFASESGKEGLREYLKNMNMTYSNALEELKKKYDVTSSDSEETLFNEEFVQEIMVMADQQGIPKMAEGGTVEDVNSINTQADLDSYGIRVDINVWNNMDDKQKRAWLLDAAAKRSIGGEGNLAEMQDLITQRQELIPELGLAAGSAYKTKEGGLGGLMGKLQAAKAGEALAKDKLLADQMTGLSSGSSGSYTTPSAVTSQKVGIQGKEDVSTFNSMVRSLDGTGTENAIDVAIVKTAEYGGLPPKLYSDFHKTFTGSDGRSYTWPEFYSIFKSSKMQGETPVDTTSEQFYLDAINQWKQRVGPQ